MTKRAAPILLLAIIYLAFISLGLPDTVLGIAWPWMRVDFGMPLEALGYLTVFGTIFTALSSIMSGRVLARFGTGRVTFVSCAMTALGLLGYSFAPSFLWLFAFLPFLGFGAGCIDCGLNAYVATHYSSRHMNWLHCAWGIGATLGPLLMTGFLAAGRAWRAGYRTTGTLQLGLAAILFVTLGLWTSQNGQKTQTKPVTAPVNDSDDSDSAGAKDAKTAAARKRAIRIQIAIYALYASCEFLVGIWAYSLLVQGRGVDKTAAGIWISFFYGSLTGTRFLTGLVVNRTGNRFMIKAGLSLALIGSCLFALQCAFPSIPDESALVALILMGAGFAPVYPCMTHETPRRFKPGTALKIVGYQSGAANLGAATFPALVGWAGSRTTLEILPVTEAVLIGGTLALMAMLDRLTAKEPI